MLKEVIRRARSNPSLKTPSTRSSIRPVDLLTMPSFRWWDGDKTPTHHKSPLLGLKLSSNSFLDSSLEDDLSATTVYTIKTTEAYTTVLRYGNENDPLEIAMINWPGAASTIDAREDNNPPLVKMKDCRWSEGPTFLKSGSHPNSSRKFTIPDYPNSIKWKRYGNSYWCTTSGIKGPIAILDLASGQDPIRLVIYETLRVKSDSQVLPSFKGVSFVLLDYLIVTALLCVTDAWAWREVNTMQDITPWNGTNSVREMDVVSQFSGHSSALWSGEQGSKPSETCVSSFPPSPQTPKLCGSGMTRPEASRSMWYTDTPTIKDSLKALLINTTPDPSTEAVQHPCSSASHTMPVKKPIQSLRNMPSVLPLFSQLSRPSTSTGCTNTSSSSIFKADLSRSLDQPTTRINSPQQSPFGLDNKESSPSEQLSNVSHTPNGSLSYRRPLPNPPRESTLRRTQSSSSPSTATSTHTSRSLPPTPLLEVPEPNESRPVVSGDSRIHSRSPPMIKVSQELTRWVHELTDPQVLSTTPSESPATVVFDLPPPAYSSIYIAQGDKPNCVTTPATTTAPST